MNTTSSVYCLATLLGIMTATLAVPSAASAPDAGTSGQKEGCHTLMTEKECATFVSTLAALPPGAARERFLQAHLQTKREREQACNGHALFLPVIYYPRTTQAALDRTVTP